ncbi:MAG: hypothetical protein ACYC6L_13395, partial [Anaerolineae bacterium]
ITPAPGCEGLGNVVALEVPSQGTAEIRARCTANGLKAGEECQFSAQLYVGGAPQDQVAVYFKGVLRVGLHLRQIPGRSQSTGDFVFTQALR